MQDSAIQVNGRKKSYQQLRVLNGDIVPFKLHGVSGSSWWRMERRCGFTNEKSHDCALIAHICPSITLYACTLTPAQTGALHPVPLAPIGDSRFVRIKRNLLRRVHLEVFDGWLPLKGVANHLLQLVTNGLVGGHGVLFGFPE